MRKIKKVLAVDGGGARGLIPSLILDKIQKRCSQLAGREVRIHELFDVIAGTSTGAVITLMLTKPEPMTTDAMITMYETDASAYFHRDLPWRLRTLDGWIGPKYPSTGVERTLKKYLGEQPELKEALTEVVIPIYDMRKYYPRTVLFSRLYAREFEKDGFNFKMWHVARAATSAPTVFPSIPFESVGSEKKRTYHPVDGGVYLNNPALEGLCHAMRLERPLRHPNDLGQPVKQPSIKNLDTDFVVVSVGTGYHDTPVKPESASHWGLAGWAPHILDVLFEAQAAGASMEIEEILTVDHHRLQTPLKENKMLDDTSPATMKMLRESAEKYIQEKAAEIEKICQRLVASTAQAASA